MITHKTKNYIFFCISLLLIISIFWFIPFKSQANQLDITLTWSTDTYTPADYQGKALPTRNSQVEVVANIENQNAQLNNLIFKWFLNRRLKKTAIGTTGQIFKFNVSESVTKSKTVKLKISDTQGNPISGPYYLDIHAHKPKIILKPQPPYYKVTNNRIKYTATPNQKIIFTAKPYFFNISRIDQLNYKWSLDKQLPQQKTTKKPNVFALNIGNISQVIHKNLELLAVNKNSHIEMGRSFAKILFQP